MQLSTWKYTNTTCTVESKSGSFSTPACKNIHAHGNQNWENLLVFALLTLY